jgi:hypothetical protein
MLFGSMEPVSVIGEGKGLVGMQTTGLGALTPTKKVCGGCQTSGHPDIKEITGV